MNPFVLDPPLEQSPRRRKYFLLGMIVCCVTGLVLSFTYRPFIYAKRINDFHLADTLGNIVAVPAAAFFFYALHKKASLSIAGVLALDFLTWCLYEAVISRTFDWWDILASFIMCFVTYPILRCMDKIR
ncbi:MAG: hypothetical protein IJL91_02835 [Bacteroidales bacterium]|nr:hypothetical protein [Bacteroidales bacterium]